MLGWDGWGGEVLPGRKEGKKRHPMRGCMEMAVQTKENPRGGDEGNESEKEKKGSKEASVTYRKGRNTKSQRKKHHVKGE